MSALEKFDLKANIRLDAMAAKKLSQLKLISENVRKRTNSFSTAGGGGFGGGRSE